jgi:hypothetical protein
MDRRYDLPTDRRPDPRIASRVPYGMVHGTVRTGIGRVLPRSHHTGLHFNRVCIAWIDVMTVIIAFGYDVIAMLPSLRHFTCRKDM